MAEVAGAPEALEMLLQRLNWPVPMVRWRAAKAVRNLLNSDATRSTTTTLLLDFLQRCSCESETTAVLSVVQMTKPDARPGRVALVSRIHHRSVLADAILERAYGARNGMGGWQHCHSGFVPRGFVATEYFDEHKAAHVPGILASNIDRLQNATGYPFRRQWAFEWQSLCERTKTGYTLYPHYFDDAIQTPGHVVGQYWQRQSEMYRSAYLRTLHLAVGEVGLSREIATRFCAESVPSIEGLFDIEPGSRPIWLGSIPERCVENPESFPGLMAELTTATAALPMRPVSVRMPIARSATRYADLTLTAALASPDFVPRPGAGLNVPLDLMDVGQSFALTGRRPEVDLDDAQTSGATGFAVPVCTSLMPMPYGIWHLDYLAVGMPIPTSYCLPADSVISCSTEGIHATAANSIVASLQFWHDEWTPNYPKEGNTRCGVVTTLDARCLSNAEQNLGLKLCWFATVRHWAQPTSYGAPELSERDHFHMDAA
jgi:hypothetical protein